VNFAHYPADRKAEQVAQKWPQYPIQKLKNEVEKVLGLEAPTGHFLGLWPVFSFPAFPGCFLQADTAAKILERKSNRSLIYIRSEHKENHMIEYEHDRRRKLRLLTQQEVCDLAGCSRGCFQHHLRHGWIEAPAERLNSRFYYGEEQTARIVEHFRQRKRWERCSK